MSVLVVRGDARNLPLPDASVDLIVTSPPYFGLRSYTDGGEHYDRQLGSEATPGEYVAALVECTAEWVRVLKPCGSLFVNLGDKYSQRVATRPSSHQDGLFPNRPELRKDWKRDRAAGLARMPYENVIDDAGNYIPEKSLMGLPWRYALAATDQLGLILRAEIIWAKPNGLPESVTDRVRRAHEQVFHFTRQPRYYSAVDEIREPHAAWRPSGANALAGQQTIRKRGQSDPDERNPLGKLPGSVWNIPSQPLTVPPALGVDHFAAFPMELPRRIIAGWSPRAVCADCGFLLGSSYDTGMLGMRNRVHPSHKAGRQGRAVLQSDLQQQEHRTEPGIDHLPASDDSRLRRGLEAGSPDGAEERICNGAPAGNGRAHRPEPGASRGSTSPEQRQDGQSHRESGAARQDRARQDAQAAAQAVRMSPLRRTHPHHRNAEHACPHCGSDQLRPSVVVDGFGGTGTTALLAHALGRHGITIDHSADYCRIAAWRTQDPAERARALEVPKPPVIPEGMDALF